MAKEEYSWRDSFSELIEKKHKEEKKLTGEGVITKNLSKFSLMMLKKTALVVLQEQVHQWQKHQR